MPDHQDGPVRLTVLGPVRAWHADTEIPVGPPQVRSLLAILLAQIGRPVSLAEIVESLWGQQPPARAINAVHGHISTLRRALEPDLRSRETGRWLRRAAGGYLLAADAGRVDLLEFRDLVARARGADGQDRADLHAAALRLWTGQCGSNIDPSVRTLPIFGELDRECFAVAREAADAAIASGQAGRVVAVVRSAADRDLLDEPLQARLILLLAASGQQAQALGRFEQVRSALADDLGVDPGGELRAAQGVVLRQSDPAAPPPGTPTPPAPEFWGTRPRPAQLPSDLSTFSGRESELGQAASLLPRVGARSRGATIVAISGMAGVGKTTLAIHWAHQLADQYPDGQLYVNLRGFDPIGRVVDPTEPLANILEALGAAPDRMPRTAESRAALFRSLLAGRRMLVVIDNARDADQARPLLPGSADCLVIVTSRNRLAGLVAAQGAHPLALRTLSDEAARVLLARRLGVARLDADPEATSAVIRYCGGLPLALAIVAARAVIDSVPSLSAIAADLGDATLNAFADTDPSIDARAVFSWSYHALGSDAARLFRQLGGARLGPDISLAAVVSLAGSSPGRVRPLLAELCRSNLVTETASGRYHMHDLVAAYAAECGEATDDPAERLASTRRLINHYVQTALVVGAVLGTRDELPGPPVTEPGTRTESIMDRTQAASWMAAEQSTVLAAVQRACRDGLPGLAWRLCVATGHLLRSTGRPSEYFRILRSVVEMLQGSDERQGYAYAATHLCNLMAETGDDVGAEILARSAYDIFTELDDQVGLGAACRALAGILADRRQYDKAHAFSVEALEHYAVAGDELGQAFALNGIGYDRMLAGAYDESIAWCGRALVLFRKLSSSGGEAATWDTIGSAEHGRGDTRSAVAAFELAVGIRLEVGDRPYAADSLHRLGDVRETAGDVQSALAAWRRAHDIMAELGHHQLPVVAAKLAANLAAAQP